MTDPDVVKRKLAVPKKVVGKGESQLDETLGMSFSLYFDIPWFSKKNFLFVSMIFLRVNLRIIPSQSKLSKGFGRIMEKSLSVCLSSLSLSQKQLWC